MSDCNDDTNLSEVSWDQGSAASAPPYLSRKATASSSLESNCFALTACDWNWLAHSLFSTISIALRSKKMRVSDGIARMLRDTSLATEPRVEY